MYLNGTQLASAPVGAASPGFRCLRSPAAALKLLTVSYTGTDTVAGSATVALVVVR